MPLRALREARIGERMAFSASVRGMRVVPMNVRRGYRLEAVVDDGDFAVSRHVAGAAARLVFFSYKKQYVDWLSMRLRSGAIVVIAGEPSEFNGQLQFTHPEIMTVAPGSGPADGEYSGVVQMSALKYDADTVEAGLRRISRPRPVYHASSRISSEHIHESIVQCIELLAGTGQDLPGDAATEAPQTMKPMEDGGISGAGTAPADAESRSGNAVAVGLARAIPDVLPESVRESNHLLHRAEASWPSTTRSTPRISNGPSARCATRRRSSRRRRCSSRVAMSARMRPCLVRAWRCVTGSSNHCRSR